MKLERFNRTPVIDDTRIVYNMSSPFYMQVISKLDKNKKNEFFTVNFCNQIFIVNKSNLYVDGIILNGQSYHFKDTGYNKDDEQSVLKLPFQNSIFIKNLEIERYDFVLAAFFISEVTRFEFLEAVVCQSDISFKHGELHFIFTDWFDTSGCRISFPKCIDHCVTLINTSKNSINTKVRTVNQYLGYFNKIRQNGLDKLKIESYLNCQKDQSFKNSDSINYSLKEPDIKNAVHAALFRKKYLCCSGGRLSIEDRNPY